MSFLDEELAKIRKELEDSVEGLEILSTSQHSVQVKIWKTEYKQLRLLIMFPEEYPHKCLMVEVKSKSLPERVMKLIENIAEKEAKKLKGQYQVIQICKVARQFLDENMFIVCADELDAVKSKLLEEGDEIKIKQKAGSFQLTAHKNGYYMNLKFSVTDDYPETNAKVECKSTNFPADLAAMFVRQGVELSRRCVVPPAIEKKGEPPFQVKPSILPAAEYLIKDCIKFYPIAQCSICDNQTFPLDPEDVTQDIRGALYVEYVYCSHVFHHKCLDRYMKSPPFKGGKKCPICGKRIYHEKWKATPELAEQRWAYQQAKRRELDEVTDFMDF